MSDSESHFQAFDEILGGRLGKKKPSPAPHLTGTASRPYENDTPAENETAPSEDSAGSRERKWPGEEGDDDISLIVDQWSHSQAFYVHRSVNPDTGSAFLSCTIEVRALGNVIRGLRPPVAYSLAEDSDLRTARLNLTYHGIVIDAPFHDLYFARAELTRRMEEDIYPLSRHIGELLDFIKSYFKSTEAELDNLMPRGVITHRLLWTMFPPGTLVYLRQPTLLCGLAYEQCIVVESTSYIQSRQGNELSINGKEWRFTGFGYHRVVSTTYIAEFWGVRNISAETLTHLPFSSLSEALQNDIKRRLIERAKRYLEFFARPASVWEYEGPAWIWSQDDVVSALTDTLEASNTFPGNWMVKERVVVESRLMDQNYGHMRLLEGDAPAPTLDHSKPIDEETYLTCSGFVSASLIDTEQEASRLILSRLRPVRWEPDALHDVEVAQKDTILHQVQNFSAKEQVFQPVVAQRRPHAGLVIWLKGALVKNKSFARHIAESSEKLFVQKDLLRFLGGDWEDGPVMGILTSLKPTVDWQCVIFLENCGKLMERRLIDEPERAFEITRFFDMLNFYRGIIFLSPGTVNDADPLFDELSVVCV